MKFFHVYFSCFVHWVYFHAAAESVKSKNPPSSRRARLLLLKPGFVLTMCPKWALKWWNNRLQAAYNVVFRCVLLSEGEGTLFASAPSRPDVPALKELGVASDQFPALYLNQPVPSLSHILVKWQPRADSSTIHTPHTGTIIFLLLKTFNSFFDYIKFDLDHKEKPFIMEMDSISNNPGC